MKKEIGLRIKAAREAAGLKLQQLSDLTGGQLSVSRISNFEQGLREPDAQTVMLLATKLGKTPCFLMFGSQSSNEISAPVPDMYRTSTTYQIVDQYSAAPPETQTAVDLLLAPLSERKLLSGTPVESVMTALEGLAMDGLQTIKNGGEKPTTSDLVKRKIG
ncbi:helix-turn-helix transcriptional regulator [Candidatus Methylospira mobilis]|uniref:Helix-turn-helix transcriptional regulator n=1 Tax=Candidatus Methylospira mobilis TaxID=1808979 RepID=A0A5Q0BGL2_9GAMM|nr:helix-turn-helix transcriptional regulator [Candidatus Methylospira mobilis]QFY42963.1 helix-turn-helix transcriptional regulator [Candidatus Methylospira mobilis]